MSVTKLFRASLGLKSQMLLIIKVNISIDLRLFLGYTETVTGP